jgi:hypothetical protein
MCTQKTRWWGHLEKLIRERGLAQKLPSIATCTSTRTGRQAPLRASGHTGTGNSGSLCEWRKRHSPTARCFPQPPQSGADNHTCTLQYFYVALRVPVPVVLLRSARHGRVRWRPRPVLLVHIVWTTDDPLFVVV